MSEFFPKSFGFFVRSKFPLMFLSVISFLAIGAVSVKLSDILSDYLLDNTFRKYVYNLNSLDPTKLNNKFQEINKINHLFLSKNKINELFLTKIYQYIYDLKLLSIHHIFYKNIKKNIYYKKRIN